MNAKFNLPDFIAADKAIGMLVNLKRSAPEVYLPHTEIASVFGNFPNSIWNGGGVAFGRSYDKNEIKSIIQYYNFELGLPLRFTFTNPLIDDRHTGDFFCNMIAECGHNGRNEILTSSPTLEKYLREYYPNYRYIRSIIGAEHQPYDTDEKYYMSVMRRNMNNNWEFLDSIPMEHRAHIEFLCTDPCPDNCPRLYTHYRDFARATLEFDKENPACECSMKQEKGRFYHHYATTQLKTFISREMIDRDYLPKGFNQFKISGRGSFTGVLSGALEYMIEPEYKIDVMQMIVGQYLN